VPGLHSLQRRGRRARIHSQRGMAEWPEKRILSRGGKRIGQRTDASKPQVSPGVAGCAGKVAVRPPLGHLRRARSRWPCR
jgi:hypothetical protein